MKKNIPIKTTTPLEAGAAMIIKEMGTPDAFISFLVDAIEWTHDYIRVNDVKNNDPHYELSNFMLEGMAIPWLKVGITSSKTQDAINVIVEGLRNLLSHIDHEEYQEKVLSTILPAFANEFKDSVLGPEYLENSMKGINCLFKIYKYLEEYEINLDKKS